MKDTSKHSPTPWEADGTRVYLGGPAMGGFDLRRCPNPEANAALIVEAVNSYDANRALIAELVKALEGAFFWAEDAGSPHADRISEIAKAALAKAKAVQP
jgi:ABC-type nitrate/sulfonate/bicarbonate transport system substrate-binding protein